MRVGVYVDGFNLYYGGRGYFGRGAPGWRWLDLRALATKLVGERQDWSGATVTRLVYCTAMIDAHDNPAGRQDQNIYVKALLASGSADHVELGHYVHRVKRGPLATTGPKGRPLLSRAAWPIQIRDGQHQDVPQASFMASYAYREEKGSDVNVAAHLLVDVLTGQVDAAIVISNDSDLRLPVEEARQRVPVGTVNPTSAFLAGRLKGTATQGAGLHWWRQLEPADFTSCQLPDPVLGVGTPLRKPSGW